MNTLPKFVSDPINSVNSFFTGSSKPGTTSKPESIADRVNKIRTKSTGMFSSFGSRTSSDSNNNVPITTCYDVLAAVNTLANSMTTANNMTMNEMERTNKRIELVLANQAWIMSALQRFAEDTRNSARIDLDPVPTFFSSSSSSASVLNADLLSGAAAPSCDGTGASTSEPVEKKKGFFKSLWNKRKSGSSPLPIEGSEDDSDVLAGAATESSQSKSNTHTGSVSNPETERRIRADTEQLKKDDAAAIKKKKTKTKEVKAGSNLGDDTIVAIGETADGNVVIAAEMSEQKFEEAIRT